MSIEPAPPPEACSSTADAAAAPFPTVLYSQRSRRVPSRAPAPPELALDPLQVREPLRAFLSSHPLTIKALPQKPTLESLQGAREGASVGPREKRRSNLRCGWTLRR